MLDTSSARVCVRVYVCTRVRVCRHVSHSNPLTHFEVTICGNETKEKRSVTPPGAVPAETAPKPLRRVYRGIARSRIGRYLI